MSAVAVLISALSFAAASAAAGVAGREPSDFPATPTDGATAADSSQAFLWLAGQVETLIHVAADSLRQSLPFAWIRPETFRMSFDDTLLTRGVDYLLDPRRGTVRFLRSFPEGAAMEVSYRFFPAAVSGEYLRHRPDAHSDDAVDRPVTGRDPRAQRQDPESETRLDISGSKTFSLEAGSRQDMALRQSLDLTASGRVGRDVEVRAILSDRDTPLQPDGTSTRLEDLDRILVEIEGPRAAATLGDFQLVLPHSEFAGIRRQLEGVRAEASPGQVGVFGAGAGVPGAPLRTEFFGTEGKQGPYMLGPSRTAGAGVMVAGSERVWLDGRQLRRGESEDYIIDYAEAALIFTSRNVITAYSEIAVDFEFSRERYHRSLYAGGWSWGGSAWRRGVPAPGPERLEVRALFLMEGDDRNRPRIPLTEARKESLRLAGDSVTVGLRSGIVFVGEGGDYNSAENDTLAVPFFLFAGQGNGSYLVRFEDVGAELGDYSDSTTADGFRYYRYEGRRKGRFLPGDAVPRPERTSIVSLVSTARPADKVSVSAEVALSDHDANTFSSRDDGDNQGIAVLVGNEFGPFVAGPVSVNAGGRFRQVGSRFRSMDRLDPSFHGRDWNVDQARLESGDRRRSVFMRLGWAGGDLRAEVGDLDNWTDYRGDRGLLEARSTLGPLQVAGRGLRVRTRDRLDGVSSSGRMASETARAAWPGSLVALSIAWSRELRETALAQGVMDQDGLRRGSLFREGRVRLGSGSRFTALSTAVEFQRRARWTIEGAGRRKLDVGDTGLLQANWSRGRGRRLEGEFSVRQLRPGGEGQAVNSRIGRLLWTERRTDDAWIQEGRWELSTSEAGFRRKEVRYAGPNAGHYDSLGVYQGVGDYDIFYLEVADSTRVNRIDFSLRNEFDLARLEDDGEGGDGLERVLRTARLIHYWNARLETDRSAGHLWERIAPGLWGAEPMSMAEVRMRADLSVLQGARWASPRLRQERERRHRSNLVNAREENRRTLWALRLRSRPGNRWTTDQELEWESTKSRTSLAGMGGRTDGWRSFRLRCDQGARLPAGLAAGLDLSGRYRERVMTGEAARVYETTPSLVWSPRPRSRVELRTTRTWVSRSRRAGAASRDLEIPGLVSRLVATVQMRGSVDLSVWAQDRQPDDGVIVRDMRLEVRATF